MPAIATLLLAHFKATPWAEDHNSNYSQYSTGECESNTTTRKPEDYLYTYVIYITYLHVAHAAWCAL